MVGFLGVDPVSGMNQSLVIGDTGLTFNRINKWPQKNSNYSNNQIPTSLPTHSSLLLCSISSICLSISSILGRFSAASSVHSRAISVSFSISSCPSRSPDISTSNISVDQSLFTTILTQSERSPNVPSIPGEISPGIFPVTISSTMMPKQ